MSFENNTRDQVERRVRKIVRLVVIGLVFFLIAGPLIAFIVMLLWNASITPMFELTPITYLQAIWLFILAKILFGFGNGTDGGRRRSRAHGERGARFRTYWQDEGKAAYEAYKAGRGEGSNDEVE